MCQLRHDCENLLTPALLSWSPLGNTVGVRRLGRPLREWLAPRRLPAEWFTEHAGLSPHAGRVLDGVARMNPAEQTG